MKEFTTPTYSGVWLPFDGNRETLRARIQEHLRGAFDAHGRLDVLANGPHWTPSAVGGTPLEISYSHSSSPAGGQALLIYSTTHRLGVDIERADRVLNGKPEAIAARYFHARDVESIRREPGLFMTLWCKKEAYAKLDRGGLVGTFRVSLSPAPEGVSLQEIPVAPQGWLAVAATAPIMAKSSPESINSPD
ncbi:MAG: 4'-phosphopantetheinyl transferase superfamily protein [Bdellovibrionales bacterium]|nr:4'-phosphopantetheinyl transferase superfamily protein [Bdellovibrionales bacterium]